MTIPVNSGLTYFRVMTLCDGIVLASPECYEPNTITFFLNPFIVLEGWALCRRFTCGGRVD